MQPRPLPAETVTSLVPPLSGFPFFEGAAQFPFEYAASSYSAVNAWWLADASFLAYGTEEFVREAFAASPLNDLGFEASWLGDPSTSRGLVLRSEKAIIVAFRGTRLQSHNIMDVAELVMIHEDDLWTDSRFLPAVCEAGGHVHEGFHQAFLETIAAFEHLLQTRREEQTLWLTGHSLGGALALLSAAHATPTAVQGLYTYGCPRVGDEAFVGVLPKQSHFRFVHRDDWVPTVPPELLGYRHGGQLRWLPGAGPRYLWKDIASGTELLVAALKSMASQIRIDVGKLPFKISGLTDHAAIYYPTILWNELLASEPLPGPRPSNRSLDLEPPR